MTGRTADGSAGDADHAAIGAGYAAHRRPEPRIAALVEQALGGAPGRSSTSARARARTNRRASR